MSEMSEGFRHILRSHSFLEETKLDLLEKDSWRMTTRFCSQIETVVFLKLSAAGEMWLRWIHG
jgi:hypothetical protein